jgi:hypothetical protein
LPDAVRKQAVLAVKDEYTFDFVDMAEEHSERQSRAVDASAMMAGRTGGHAPILGVA